MLAGDEFDRAAKARGIASSEQMLRGRGVGQARTTHFLADGEIDADRVIGRFRMPVASTGINGGCGNERLDCVSGHFSLHNAVIPASAIGTGEIRSLIPLAQCSTEAGMTSRAADSRCAR